EFQVSSERYAWVQVANGIIHLNGEELRQGDGLQLKSNQLIEIQTSVGAEVLLFDLA
ncbi:MAG: pirin family protein, partial [Cyanobacteria bacterium J06636_16]